GAGLRPAVTPESARTSDGVSFAFSHADTADRPTHTRKDNCTMKPLLALSLALFLAGTGTAAAQDVRYNFDKQANFASFKTYKWVTIKGATQLSELADKQVKDAVDAELAKKGLAKAAGDTADLYVGYQAGVGQEKEYTSFDTGYG